MTESPAFSRLIAVLSHPEEVDITLPWSVSLARQWDLPLVLLHVIDPVVSRELPENARAMADDMLALLASGPALEGLQVSTRVEEGSPGAVLADVVAEQQGSIPVLAAGQHGTFAKALLGRGRDNVIHQLASPFVFVPSGTRVPGVVSRVIVGMDGSAAATEALDLIASQVDKGAVIEVQAVEPGTLVADDYLAFEPAFSERSIRMRGRAGVVLLAAARSREAGLIAVGRHGNTGMFGRYLGGTAEWLTRNADRPLLIVPGRAK